MSGFGHSVDMINRLKHLRNSRKKEGFKANYRTTDFSKIKAEFKTVSESELEILKQKIRVKAKQDYHNFIIRFVLLLLLLSSIIFYIIKHQL